MTLLWMDGFDAQDVLTKWSVIGGTGMDFATYAPRFSTGYAVATNGAITGATLQMGITASAKVIAGCAIRWSSVAAHNFIVLLGDSGATSHITITCTASGALQINRGGTQVAITGAGVFTAGNWYYVEVSATISDTVGAVDVHVNGVSALTFSGDTKNAGTATTIDTVQFFLRSNGTSAFDDVYICNGLGSINNNFLGDVRVQTLRPNGAGSQTDFTPVGSGTNYLNVDEVALDSADYNYSGTATQRDLYAMEDVLGGTSAVLGVQVNALARKTDTGSRSIKNLVKVGGTVTASSAMALAANTDDYCTTYDVNPTTSAAWAVSDITALEAGVEVV